MGLSEKLHKHRKQIQGGYSVRDWVPPRAGELHLPLGNYIGPGTDIRRRIREGVKPTTNTDAAARVHDIEYHNIGARLATGRISRAVAAKQVKASDNKLMKAALKSKLSLNPVENAHSTAAIAGILGKKGLQAVGAMDQLKFVGNDQEEIEGGKKKKKKDPLSGLRKRFKKLKAK